MAPGSVQVNEVGSPSGAVNDWRIEGSGNSRVLMIFLDRQLSGEMVFQVDYDRSLSSEPNELIPLLSARDVHRQRGMVAYLSGRDLTLNPTAEDAATRVGENQLPAYVKDAIDKTIAHTFKYADQTPELRAEVAAPERVAGKFDAQVDTLLSLGEVTLTGTVSVEVNVKSGVVDRLELTLPADAELLGLTAPSLRTHRVNEDDPQLPLVEVEFTQDMEGQFRIELSYERILQGDENELEIATPHVVGAEVEQGRIAVEALSAVEVRASAATELSRLDTSELPRQLLLRTSKPVLLAFKYVRAEPAPRLTLAIERHRVVDVQEAIIDRADYRTLYTRDGLSVTTARFFVRNARKQFLRIELPEDSEVWSAFVAGRPEKPALSEGEGGAQAILLQIVNSTEGFPVDLIYATPAGSIGGLGTVEARLPRPDILVTQSQWDVYLPDGLVYSQPVTNMELLASARQVTAEEMDRELAGWQQQAQEPLKILVPTSGVHFGFAKLYANQGDVVAGFAVAYSSTGGMMAGQTFCLLGVGLLWIGAGALAWRSLRLSRRAQIAAAAGGIAILVIGLGFYRLSATPSLVLAVVLALTSARPYGKNWIARWRSEPPAEQES